MCRGNSLYWSYHFARQPCVALPAGVVYLVAIVAVAAYIISLCITSSLTSDTLHTYCESQSLIIICQYMASYSPVTWTNTGHRFLASTTRMRNLSSISNENRDYSPGN